MRRRRRPRREIARNQKSDGGRPTPHFDPSLLGVSLVTFAFGSFVPWLRHSHVLLWRAPPSLDRGEPSCRCPPTPTLPPHLSPFSLPPFPPSSVLRALFLQTFLGHGMDRGVFQRFCASLHPSQDRIDYHRSPHHLGGDGHGGGRHGR